MTADPLSGLEVRSLVSADGELRINLEETTISVPGSGEVVVRIEAAPLNPSDLGLLFAGADLSTLRHAGTGASSILSAKIPEARLKSVEGRFGQVLAIGNEGAGTVVRAGPDVQDLLGRRVGVFGGGTYSQYRQVSATNCIVLPDDATAADGASMFVNPLTALAMVETLRREGHRALIHTAAASNLGQMLVRICLADGVGLVNVVRSPAQAEILRTLGAKHVVDSSSADFADELTDAVAQTGATLCFDAIGGGALANTILHAMENAAQRTSSGYSRYGSTKYKQVYVYGGLDTGPTFIDRGFGMSWGVSGFLIMNFLEEVGPETAAKMRERVASELKTTFASSYTRTISLMDLLRPEVVEGYHRKATGEKYLLDPRLN